MRKIEAQRFSVGLREISLILILIGLIVSGYLSYVKLLDEQILCVEGEAFNCDLVQNSAYATVMGIPIAYLGLLTYILIGALVLLQDRLTILQNYGQLILFAVTLFAFIYSMWLVYVQAVLLQSFCTWCLVHETTITLLLIINSISLWRELQTSEDEH